MVLAALRDLAGPEQLIVTLLMLYHDKQHDAMSNIAHDVIRSIESGVLNWRAEST